MSNNFDQKQFDRVKHKLLYMNRVSPALVNLNAPWGQPDANAAYPEDYWKIVTEVANGGTLPPFFATRYWRSIQSSAREASSLWEPFPLTYSQYGAEMDPFALPGQLILMGDRELSWSLIVSGPCRGEVWTIGSFGALRNPACTFIQWLELVLDGNLLTYMSFCVTGKEEDVSRYRRFWDMLRMKPLWPLDEEPEKRCDRWLERHRKPVPGAIPTEELAFHYEGNDPNSLGKEYVYNSMKLALIPPPEETFERTDQIQAEAAVLDLLTSQRIRWEDPEEMAELARIAGRLRNGVESQAISDHDRLLLQTAKELVEKNAFQKRGCGIRELSFLAGATQLRKLDICNNDVLDLTPLSELVGLKELNVAYNGVSDLSPISALPLCQLDLRGNHVSSLEPLQGMHTLNKLSLRGCPLEPGTLLFLRKCKRLGMLNLSNTGICDLRELEFCRAWDLDLTGCPDLTGLEVLASMKNLSCLYIDTIVAKQFHIREIYPRFTEYAELGGISLFTWPAKYYN